MDHFRMRLELNGREEHIAKLGFGYVMKRVIPFGIREDLFERGLYEDLVDEIYCIVLEARNIEDDKEVFRYISKRIYAFLRNYGYRRIRGYNSYVHDIIEEEGNQECVNF